MTQREKTYLTGKIRELARLVSGVQPARMEFNSEEEFLRMLSLEVVPVPATQKPIRVKRRV